MSDRAPAVNFLVNKTDWKSHCFEEVGVPELAAGEVLFRVDRFAFTANNITYAVAGDMLGYWNFFPAPDGWGRLPTMGFGDVIASSHPEVAEGTRCFGFYPMSRYLKVEPGEVSPTQIVDAAAHRKDLALAYNQYSPVGRDALYDVEHEDTLMLLRGLFMTSFLADDFLADNDHYGAESILISSASSKTSIALGHLVQRGGRARAVGLTSDRNLEFVRGLGCYDQVITYDEVGSLDPAKAAVIVDMAGNGQLMHTIHSHFGDSLKHSCAIGMTHWDATPSAEALPGPTPEFFFAPSQIQKRVADWGASVLQERLVEAWTGFRSFADTWLVVQRGQGRSAVERVYMKTLNGETQPQHGHVLSLWD